MLIGETTRHDTEQCEQCKSDTFTLLGTLGPLTWVRCRHCGWDQTMSHIDDTDDIDD